MLSVRIVNCDHYISVPIPELDVIYSDFRGSEVKQVPILRIFGSDATGQKTCLHIHGVFPYIYIAYDGQEPSGRLQYQIAASLDRALNISLGKASSTVQHVYKIVLVSGRPFYGYHRNKHQYFKIYLYNPMHKKRATDLLQSGAVLDKIFQTYHAHVPYTMQFLIDYNLHGMSTVTLATARFRRDGNEHDGEHLLPESVARCSTCRVEADGLAADIVDADPDANPGLAGIWRDERARRGAEAGTSRVTPPSSQQRPERSVTEGEAFQLLTLREKLAALSSSQLEDGSTPKTPSQRNTPYPAETPEGCGLLDASHLDVPVASPSASCPRRTFPDESVGLDDRDLLLVDVLEQMAAEQDADATLGSQASDRDLALADILQEMAADQARVEDDSILGTQLAGGRKEEEEEEEDDDDQDEHLLDLSQPFGQVPEPEPSSSVVSPNSNLWEDSFWEGASPIPQCDGAEKSPLSKRGNLSLHKQSNVPAKIPAVDHSESRQPDKEDVGSGSSNTNGNNENTSTGAEDNGHTQLVVKKKRPWLKKMPPQSRESQGSQTKPVKLKRSWSATSNRNSTESRASISPMISPTNGSPGYCNDSDDSRVVYSGCSPDQAFIHSDSASLNVCQFDGALSQSAGPVNSDCSHDNTFIEPEPASLNGSHSCGALSQSSGLVNSDCSHDNTYIEPEPAPLNSDCSHDNTFIEPEPASLNGSQSCGALSHSSGLVNSDCSHDNTYIEPEPALLNSDCSHDNTFIEPEPAPLNGSQSCGALSQSSGPVNSDCSHDNTYIEPEPAPLNRSQSCGALSQSLGPVYLDYSDGNTYIEPEPAPFNGNQYDYTLSQSSGPLNSDCSHDKTYIELEPAPLNGNQSDCTLSQTLGLVYSDYVHDNTYIEPEPAPLNGNQSDCTLSQSTGPVYSDYSHDNTYIEPEPAPLNGNPSDCTLSQSSCLVYSDYSHDNTYIEPEPAPFNGNQSDCTLAQSSGLVYSVYSHDNTFIDPWTLPLNENEATNAPLSNSPGHAYLEYFDMDQFKPETSVSVVGTYNMISGEPNGRIALGTDDFFVEDENTLLAMKNADLNVTDVYDRGPFDDGLTFDDADARQDPTLVDGEPVQYYTLGGEVPNSELYRQFLLGDPTLTALDADDAYPLGPPPSGYRYTFPSDADELRAEDGDVPQLAVDLVSDESAAEYFSTFTGEYELSPQAEEMGVIEPVLQTEEKGNEFSEPLEMKQKKKKRVKKKSAPRNGTRIESMEADFHRDARLTICEGSVEVDSQQAARLARYEESINQTIESLIAPEAEKTTFHYEESINQTIESVIAAEAEKTTFHGLDENANNKTAIDNGKVEENKVAARGKKRNLSEHVSDTRKTKPKSKKPKRQRTLSLSLALAVDHLNSIVLTQCETDGETPLMAVTKQSPLLKVESLCKTFQEPVPPEKSTNARCDVSKERRRAKAKQRKEKIGVGQPSESSVCAVTDTSRGSTLPQEPSIPHAALEPASESSTSAKSAAGSKAPRDLNTGKVVVETVGSRKRYKLTTLSSQRLPVADPKTYCQKATPNASGSRKDCAGSAPSLPEPKANAVGKSTDARKPKSVGTRTARKGTGKRSVRSLANPRVRDCFVSLERMDAATVGRLTSSIPMLDGANMSSSSSSSSSDETPRDEIRSPRKGPATPKRAGRYRPLDIVIKKSPSPRTSRPRAVDSVADRRLERIVCGSGIARVSLRPLSTQELARAGSSRCAPSDRPPNARVATLRSSRVGFNRVYTAGSACDKTIISDSVLLRPCASSSSSSDKELNCDNVPTKTNDRVKVITKTARKKLSFSLLGLSNREDDKLEEKSSKFVSNRRDSVDLFCDSSSPLLSGSRRDVVDSEDELGNKFLVLNTDLSESKSTKENCEQLTKEQQHSTDDDSDNDLQMFSFYNSQFCSVDADYTFLGGSQATQREEQPKVFVPVFQPPSCEEVVASLRDLGIPECRFQEPFYSVRSDSTSVREVGHRVVKLATSSVSDLPPFESSLENVLPLEVHRMKVVQEFDSSQVFNDFESKYSNLRPALASQRDVFITPATLPPSFIEVEQWIKGKKFLKEEEEKKTGKPDTDVTRITRIVVPSSQGEGGDSDSDASLTLSPDTPPNRLAHSTPYVGPRRTNVLPSPTFTPVRISRHKRLSLLETLVEEEVDDNPSNSGNARPTRSPDIFTNESSTVAKARRNLSLRRKSHEINLKEGSESSPPKGVGPSPCSGSEDRSLHRLLLQTQFRQQLATPRTAGSSCEIDGLMDNTHGFKMSAENLRDVAAPDIAHQYLTLMVVEVHVETRGELRPDPEHDPVRAVFYTVTNDVPEGHELPRQQSGMIVVATPGWLGTTGAGCEPQYVPDERELLRSLVALVREWDPDILAGYETETASWGYLLQRAATLGTDLGPELSRVPGATRDSRYSEETGEITLVGRVVLDVWRLMRSEVALTNYSLENVAFHVLHARLPLHSHLSLSRWWQHRTGLYRHVTAEYYSLRVRAVVRMLDQLDIVGRTSELARLFGIQFFEVLSRGSQFRVESMMLRLARPLGYVALSPTVRQRARMRAPECVPLIMEPRSRFYVDPVIVLDFQSLYPSVIIAYNYCYSTCLGRVEHLGGGDPFELGCGRLKVPPSELARLEGRIHVSPVGVAFVKDAERTGVLPAMLREILETRLMVKRSMKELGGKDKTLRRVLHARQLGLKLIANVTYGYTAASFSGRMPCVEVADSVVSKGRETLERAVRLVSETERWGAEVVYGDTDSMFVLVRGRSRERAFEIGAEIAEAVTMDNPAPVKLKLEKVYQPCILQTKKRYVGYMYESADQAKPTYDAKGIETVRRDGCPAVAKMLEKSLRILFDSRDVSLVKKYVCRQFEKLMQGRTNIQDLVYAREYRGMAAYRPGACVPALELARQWMRTDKRAEPRRGQRVPYVIVAGPPGLPLIRLVRSPHDLMADPGLKVNATYYITRAIIPPLNRCLALLGADVEAWYAEMPHKAHSYLPTDVPTGQKKCTISQYFATMNCAVCNRLTNAGICVGCRARPQRTVLVLNDKIRTWERCHANITKVCQSCCGRPHSIECKSLDCPILFRKFQAARDLDQAPFARKLLADYTF